MSESLLERELFLGFEVHEKYQNQLAQVNPYLLTMFVNNENPDYLQKATTEKGTFFGKKLGKLTKLDTFDQTSDNIYSFLKKIVPNYSYEEETLFLFSITKGDLS